jgi:hypothetical protein
MTPMVAEQAALAPQAKQAHPTTTNPKRPASLSSDQKSPSILSSAMGLPVMMEVMKKMKTLIVRKSKKVGQASTLTLKMNLNNKNHH